MNQIAVVKPKSVLIDMASRYGMEPNAFEMTVRATCMPPDKEGRVASREEFAAFLLVAKEYGLNPITREIFAFKAKHGGIVPVVSVDGWTNLVNSHKECDGFSFDLVHDDSNKLVACTCRMYRKDRKHPVEITEYLSECQRPTDVWRQMPHRMMRHKALIQAARLAFGFAGIYDEDEGRTIAEAVDITPVRVPSPSEAEARLTEEIPKKDDPITSGPQPKKTSGPDIDQDYEGWLEWAREQINSCEDGGWLEQFANETLTAAKDTLFPPDLEDLLNAVRHKVNALNSED